MTSPARKHFLKASAAAQAAQSQQDAPQTGDAYQLMKVALLEDRRRLHDVQSIERKIELKRELLPQYQEYIDGVLDAGKGAQDDVLTTLMVWHLDVGQLNIAVAIGEYVLEHDLNTPEEYQRKPAAVLLEDAAEAILRKDIKPVWKQGSIENRIIPDGDQGIDAVEDLKLLARIAALTEKHDMHDQVRAKLFKASGYLQALLGDYRLALDNLERAKSLNEHAGVKKDIENLQRLVNE
ncbi:phage terminase small subunit [Marinimicrobium sp. ARAG 43.8]|uniref:phage terminase small subunit n=1 Tax=Marinimicrobium sp. ARAG 43.8 TaxID=3418719 RepID=UPI003CF76163